MKKYNKEMIKKFKRNEDGILVFPTGDYTNIGSFGEYCSFGERCSFGEHCSFGTLSVNILRSRLGTLSKKLTLELMRRDADSHPNPKLFDDWKTNDGKCPYSNNESRMHYFNENIDWWKKGKPEMRTWDLMVAIAKEKKWRGKSWEIEEM